MRQFKANAGPSAIQKGEKAEIRERLLDSGANESNRQLALQNALVTAKIIRYDYPYDWYGCMSYLPRKGFYIEMFI